MATEALLSASLQVLFQRLASTDFINFVWRRKLSQELLNDLKRKLLVVVNVLNDAEVKQFSNDLVKQWLLQVKNAVCDAEDLLDKIAADALPPRSKLLQTPRPAELIKHGRGSLTVLRLHLLFIKWNGG